MWWWASDPTNGNYYFFFFFIIQGFSKLVIIFLSAILDSSENRKLFWRKKEKLFASFMSKILLLAHTYVYTPCCGYSESSLKELCCCFLADLRHFLLLRVSHKVGTMSSWMINRLTPDPGSKTKPCSSIQSNCKAANEIDTVVGDEFLDSYWRGLRTILP